jgi:hypothetical protein
MSDGIVSDSDPAGRPAEADTAGQPAQETTADRGYRTTTASRTAVVLAGRARHGFRSWRRSRPFWAGVLLIAAGLELLMIPLPMHSMGLILHIGTGGVLGILIGAILIACAFLLWFNPAQRVFYSIVAVLLAIAALIASNLGGFLIGTLLGVVGGSMGFAWTPARHGRDTSSDRDLGNGMVLSGIPVIPVIGGILALLNLGTGGSPHGGAGATPTPTPTATSCPSPGASPTPSPGISVSIGLGTSPSPCPSSSATPGPNPRPSPSPSPGGTGHPGHGPRPKPSPGAPKSPGHGGKSGPAKRAGTSPGVNIASSPASLTAASAVITGFAYDGLATVHTARGPVKMMQFTMSSLSLSGVDLTVSQGGAVLTTHAPELDLSGKVVLYATRLSGDLLGVPVTITPQSPLATILQVTAPLTKSVPVPMTNVVTDQPYTSADSMSVNGLQIS